jgi:hypothetical protein
MSWDLQNIQSQVQLVTRQDGLTDKVTRWCNRAIMEISSSAFFGKNLKRESQFPINSGSNTITSAWNAITADNIVDIHRVAIQSPTTDTTFYNPLSRVGVRDLYAFYRGGAATVSNDQIDAYAVARWRTNGTAQMAPDVAVFPNEDSSRAMEIHYLAAPEALTTGSDTNWILRRYPEVVLNGTLRRAFLYVGNVPRYMRARSDFMNGVKDVISQELGTIAHAPVMRDIVAEYIRRMM